MKAFIEQIEKGHKEINIPLFKWKIKETPDILDISNGKPYLWIFSFSGYKQIGRFRVMRPHHFKEREWVDIEIKNGKIVKVRK